MRLASPLLTAAALLACLIVAGCVSSAGSGWTFAPAPVATPPPAASASAVPTGTAASSAAAADVTISALNIAFEQSSADAPAGKGFSLLFDNKDASVQHDVFIKDGGGTDVFEGAIITGPTQVTYNVPSIAAGSYTFFCSIHSNMTGALVVK